MHEGLIHLAASDTVALTLGTLEHDMRAIGVIAGAYFLTPAFHSQVGKRTVVKHFGFSDAVLAEYLDPTTFENDPIPDYVMRTGRTMSWKQAIERDDMTPTQRVTVDRLQEIGLINGVSVPLYGPNGRDSYSSFMFDRPLDPQDDAPLVRRMTQIARQHHHRICLLIERDYTTPVAISKRESEVLYWMARGKSNADVAAIMGIKPATVDTFVRRIYVKFNVHDRISAVFEGMSRGLLKLG